MSLDIYSMAAFVCKELEPVTLLQLVLRAPSVLMKLGDASILFTFLSLSLASNGSEKLWQPLLLKKDQGNGTYIYCLTPDETKTPCLPSYVMFLTNETFIGRKTFREQNKKRKGTV